MRRLERQGNSVDERGMLDLLGQRYTSMRRGTLSDRWVRAEHVPNRLGDVANLRTADFIALDKWPGSLGLHWCEVKVSRADWLTEMKDISKSEAFTRYAHYRWLAVADAVIVAPGELPSGWGLLVATKAGKLRAKAQAPRHDDVEPIPLDIMVSIAAAAQRTGARELGRRDAATVAYGKSWRACSVCGEVAPCRFHQVRSWENTQNEKEEARNEHKNVRVHG